MSAQNGVDGSSIVTEVPEMLRKLTLILVKVFYGPEQFILVDYIQRRTIVKEDIIRDLLKIDQKYLRQLLLQLKIDKFIKERVVAEDTDGRSRKAYYYFINYKAVLNVTKYKLDHMRQKLESREKDEVHKTAYKCNNEVCRKQYDDMDVGKIYNPTTEEMRCWQCGHLVEADESAGPSQQTRISLAKFNEQTAGIFSMLQNMNGIRFSQEILEPPIIAAAQTIEPKKEPQRVQRVGERAFSTTGKTRTELYSSGITVSIGGEVGPSVKTKEAVPWLQHNQQSLDLNETTLPDLRSSFDSMLGTLPSTKSAPDLSDLQPADASEDATPSAKRPKREDIVSLLLAEEENSMDATSSVHQDASKASSATAVFDLGMSDATKDDAAESGGEDEEEESFVTVQGKPVPMDQVDDKIVAQMTEEEKNAYVKRFQSNFYYM